MHRFRKKSETRRAQTLDSSYDLQSAPRATQQPRQQQRQDSLPPLPPASDFRTSLILPDLTRRFSVLRNSAGEPIGLDEIKWKLAEQRARGSENRVSEEEEDMILEALSRLRGRGGTARSNADLEDGTSSERVLSGYSESQESNPRISTAPSLAGGQSLLSSTNSIIHGSPSVISLSSSKGSLAGRRMSNNLFGSGKFHDHTYIRTAGHRRSPNGNGTAVRSGSVKHADSDNSMSTITSSRIGLNNSTYSDSQSLRPVTPDGSVSASSPPSSPNYAAFAGDSDTDSKADPSRTLSPEVLGRASIALDEVIRELEEEGDDEIVLERSPISSTPPVTAANLSQSMHESSPLTSSPPTSPSDSEPGMAYSSDERMMSDDVQRASPYPRAQTTSPTPGYIPGMPRPMTPRDLSFESDDRTPSATPRATSPRLPTVNHQPPPLIAQTLASGMYRSNSNASTTRASRPISPVVVTPTSAAPMFFHRTTNGRFTPEDRPRSGDGNGNSNGTDITSPAPDLVEPSVLGRRRPASPLSGPVFQPMSVTGSRPTTPSNITWNATSSPNGTRGHGRNGSMSGQSASGHSRNGSSTSTTDGSGDMDHLRSATRSLRSPTLPDSSWLDSRHASSTSLTANSDYRPGSAMSGTDAGSPVQTPNRLFRSPTPTHSAAHSPTTASFDQGIHLNGNGFSSSRRTSRQNAHSSLSFRDTPTNNALLLTTLGNSSRSSLGSAGSSYHSWDEEHKKDRLFDIFSNLDPQPEWHDLSPHRSTPSTSRTTPYESQDCENVVRRELGLNKSDIAAIQEKLVTAALTKAATPEGRHRANSVRKRRPSTSQSNYSYNGDKAAPASQSQIAPMQTSVTASTASVYATRQVNSEQLAKANALLDSVVDMIQSPRSKPVSIVDVEEPVLTPPRPAEPVITNPSPSQRHRALADALFGTEDRETPDFLAQPAFTLSVTTPEAKPQDEQLVTVVDLSSPSGRTIDENVAYRSSPTQVPSVVALAKSPSIGSLGHADPALLALEVQRRAEAATAALRKSPSIPKLPDPTGSTRRRISPNQISSPKLVSASTSVDTIPLPSASPMQARTPNPPSSSLLGGRFKRLRGTLRTKNPPIVISENSRPSVELKTPPSVQTATFSSVMTDISGKEQAMASSANETIHFKISPPPVTTPPASAGPGLKGFMSRFRKHKAADPLPSVERREPPSSYSSATASSVSTSVPEVLPASTIISQIQSAPASRTAFPSSRPLSPHALLSQNFVSPEPIPEDAALPNSAPPQAGEAALRQLFDAAHDLGLDEGALSELLARSPSTSSRAPTWTRMTRSNSVSGSRQSTRPELRDSAPSPLPSDARPNVDAASSRPSTDLKQVNARKIADPALGLRPGQTNDPSKAIVRRTIIIPSDTRASHMDFSSLARKQSTSRRRQSASAVSITSARSVIERVPTPPPPRSNNGKRFSAGRSPPVPQLPHSFTSQNDAALSPGQMEKSNSLYDSLFEMYAGDSRTPSTAYGEGQASQPVPGEVGGETGTAVEVIELANGETIWSIVNGLRDDDAESVYDNRASFTSDYSGEGVKVFFKEHGRKTSKSSNTSLLSRKKQQTPASQRPETKVFFSSSAQIGRLIENLSRDKEAGSFNIAPDHNYTHAGHSNSSSIGSASDVRWTLEERLEHMLGSMSPNTS